MVLKIEFATVLKSFWAKGLSGKEIAEKMVKENGIFDVKAALRKGALSDLLIHKQNY